MPLQSIATATKPVSVKSDKDLIEIANAMNLPRMVGSIAAFILVGALALSGSINFDPRPILFVLLPAELALSMFWAYLSMKKIVSQRLLLAQLALDVLVITYGVHLSGGAHSQFVFMYLMTIISASLVSFRAAIFISCLTIASFATLIAAGFFQASPLGGFTLTQNDDIRIAIFLMLVGFIGFQSNFYLRQIQKKDAEVLKLKDEFMFRTIHDLRSPSTILRLVLDKYREQDLAEKYPDAAADITMLKKANARMSGLVDDLLKVSRGEQNEIVFKKEPLDLTKLVQGCVDELKPAMDERKITATHDSQPLPTVGDTEKLKEIFNNFLSNAIKYNKVGGSISITHAKDAKFLITTIKDTGVGIRPENLPKMFTAYFRGDMGASIQGTGLGLYYTRKLVEKMGGKIELESEVGQGTTFRVFLPVDVS